VIPGLYPTISTGVIIIWGLENMLVIISNRRIVTVGLHRYNEQPGPGARNTYSTICSCWIVDCCCSIKVSYVVYIH
jgi:hypothetical protein